MANTFVQCHLNCGVETNEVLVISFSYKRELHILILQYSLCRWYIGLRVKGVVSHTTRRNCVKKIWGSRCSQPARGKKKEQSAQQVGTVEPHNSYSSPRLLLFLHPRHISRREASAHRQRDCWPITSSSCGSELRFIFSTHVPKSVIQRFIMVDFLAAAKIVLVMVHNNMNHPNFVWWRNHECHRTSDRDPGIVTRFIRLASANGISAYYALHVSPYIFIGGRLMFKSNIKINTYTGLLRREPVYFLYRTSVPQATSSFGFMV